MIFFLSKHSTTNEKQIKPLNKKRERRNIAQKKRNAHQKYIDCGGGKGERDGESHDRRRTQSEY